MEKSKSRKINISQIKIKNILVAIVKMYTFCGPEVKETFGSHFSDLKPFFHSWRSNHRLSLLLVLYHKLRSHPVYDVTSAKCHERNNLMFNLQLCNNYFGLNKYGRNISCSPVSHISAFRTIVNV